MKTGKQKRSIKSVKLTWRFYDAALITWILVVSLPVILMNWMLYDATQLMAMQAEPQWQELFPGAPSVHALVLGACIGSSFLVIFGLSAVGLFVSHKLTGPFINIKATCEAIQSGDTSRRLKFRETDRMDDIAEAFNAMVDRLKTSPKSS